MLPEPSFTFTIPSVHDDTTLDCRVYNPPHNALNATEFHEQWHPKGAIIAHPYAPLGGCYDDVVVLSAAAEIHKQGFVVGTFNFRGAGSSGGSTSWQAKPEIEDFVSFVGFFVHYVEGLRESTPQSPSQRTFGSKLSPITSAYDTTLAPIAPETRGMTLILGGYSYGALINIHLPAPDVILQRFQSVAKGTAEAEIRLRAVSLAVQWNKDAEVHREARQARRTDSHENMRPSARSMAVAMGGNESEPGSRRPSHESRRSLDAVRRSVDKSRRKLGLRRHGSDMPEEAMIEESLTSMKIPPPQTHYLLISPLLSLVTAFVTMFSSSIRANTPQGEEKICTSPTLAVYGDRDIFTSQKRYRRWAEGLAAKSGSRFQFREVAGAGHFYLEDGVETELGRCIREWVKEMPGCSG